LGVYRKPSTLLEELGITEPSEIDVEAVAQYCGATIVYALLSGCEARILGLGDKAIITVRADRLRARQRFSGAHELGHWMRDRHQVASYRCDDAIFRLAWSADGPEVRANRYAAELLLPEKVFKPRARGRPATFETVSELAAVFVTSLTATAIRMVEIGSSPAMLVCSSKKGRKWFAKGEDVKLWPRERAERTTVAADLLGDPSAVAPGPTEVCSDGWIDHPDARRHVIIEDSRRVTVELVLSLLWWKNELQLLELEAEEDA
jgi:Zn-dependent peptidase ImmA (M78 family)